VHVDDGELRAEHAFWVLGFPFLVLRYRMHRKPRRSHQIVDRALSAGMWRHYVSEGCVFCDQSWMRAAEIFIETPHCIFASTRDPDIRAQAGLAEGVLPGSGAIVPIAHRTSVFELTPAEWADTQDLLLKARMALHDLLAPDGYLLGWNQGGVLHPHMHVIPRFDDEPLSDRWLRSAINVPENRRPDPWAPGSGRALRGPS
jgi:diadenosine tetraphosphate (Ap4A) HIT family hydrolase